MKIIVLIQLLILIICHSLKSKKKVTLEEQLGKITILQKNLQRLQEMNSLQNGIELLQKQKQKENQKQKQKQKLKLKLKLKNQLKVNNKKFRRIFNRLKQQSEQEKQNQIKEYKRFKAQLSSKEKGNQSQMQNQMPKYERVIEDDDKNKKKDQDKQFMEDLNNLSDYEKIQKYPDQFYWEYKIDQNEIKQQQQQNMIAQEKYDNNSQGSDDYQDVKQGGLFIRMGIRQKYIKQINPDYKYYHILLNDENIYALKEENQGYRGIVGGIMMKDLLHENIDNIRMGECCESIGIINLQYYKEQDSTSSLYCFSVDTNTQEWYICDSDIGNINEWRQSLILRVILYGLKQYGIYDMSALLKFQRIACLKPKGWSYSFQSRWPCLCPEGDIQSPINIDTSKTITQDQTRLFWKYDNVHSAVIHMNQYENIILGDFGYIYSKNTKKQKNKWKANEIRFKFRSEHQVDGKSYPGEMQIWHTNGDERMAIAIFISDNDQDVKVTKDVAEYYQKQFDNIDEFIKSSMGKEFYERTGKIDQYDKMVQKGTDYIDQFYLESWPKREEGFIIDSEKCIDFGEPFVNLTRILDISFQSNSFYQYEGSDTIPPCDENVMWYILKDPVIVNSISLKLLKQRTIGELESNSRNITYSDGRQVYSHDECKHFDDDPIIEPPDNNVQYLKAKTTENYYAIMHEGVQNVFDEQGISEINMNKGKQHQFKMSKISEQEMMNISPKITRELRYQLGEWLVKNKGRNLTNYFQWKNEVK